MKRTPARARLRGTVHSCASGTPFICAAPWGDARSCGPTSPAAPAFSSGEKDPESDQRRGRDFVHHLRVRAAGAAAADSADAADRDDAEQTASGTRLTRRAARVAREAQLARELDVRYDAPAEAEGSSGERRGGKRE